MDDSTANPERTQVGSNIPGPIPGGPPPAAQPLTGDTVRLLAEQLRPVLHAETEALREELRRSVLGYRTSARLYGAAAATALYGAGALTACLILALAHGVAAWLSALIIAILLFAAAGALGQTARRARSGAAGGAARTTTPVGGRLRAQ
jgi:hypothetical protein